MGNRCRLLQEFLSSLKEAFAATSMDPQATAAIGRIEDALRTPGITGLSEGHRLPVCRHLGDALAAARASSVPIARLANAFASLEPSLHWARRPAAGPFASDNWLEGHANTTIVGPRGLEERSDLAIGVSLLAPDVRYPDHNHRPEEVYLVLSRGRFQHGASDWLECGPGGTLYNEPDITHAMASGEAPLLALWCLWMGGTEQAASLSR